MHQFWPHLFYCLFITLPCLVSPVPVYPRNFTWIDPSDLSSDECKNDLFSLNSCCSCVNCPSSESIKKDLELLTPYTPPLVLPKEQFGSSLCVSADNSYALIGTEPLTTNDKTKPAHLLWNLNSFGYQNGAYYFDPNHSTIGDVTQSSGYSFECYQEYIIVSNGYDTIQVFVKTQNPPWSLLKTIHRSDVLSGDDYYEESQTFPFRAIFAETTKQLLICDTYSTNVFVFSIYNLQTPFTISYSVFEDQQSRNTGGILEYCHPNLYLSTSRGTVLAYEYVQITKTWEQRQELSYDVSIGGSLSCAAGFVFASTANQNFNSGSLQTSETTVVIFEKTVSVWSLFQIISEPIGSDGFSSYSFGYSLSSFEYYISSIDRGIRLAISDPFKPVSASATGTVYVYEFNGQQFKLCTSLSDAPLSFKTNFGYSLALSNSHLVIGAPDNSQNAVGSGGGNAYTFNLSKTPCIGCDNIINSCSRTDVCKVCNGDNSTCAGCDRVPYSGLKFDSCGVCNGDDSTCVSIFPASPLTLDVYCNVTTYARLYMVIPMFESMKGNRIGQNKIDIRMDTIESPKCGSITLSSFWEISAADFTSSSSSYRTKCTQNCLYFSIEITYTAAKSCQYISNGDVRSGSFIDEFSVAFQASKASKPILFPRIVSTRASYHGCTGCDESFKISPADATSLDQCLICGGDGKSCLDCMGLPFGDSFLDFCQKCVTEDTANKTCIYAQLLPQYEPISIQCSQSLILDNFMDIGPVNSQRSLRWKILSKYSPCGSSSVKYTSGTFSFSPSVSSDCSQQILLETSDTWKNSITTPLDINVYGCDIVGCDMVKGSGKTYDKCGVCDGNNTCVDCLGVPFGTAKRDLCGDCNGNNSTCDVRMEQIKNMLLQYEQIEMYQQGGGNQTPLWQLIFFPVFGISIFVTILIIIALAFLFSSRKSHRKRLRYAIPTGQPVSR